MTKRGFLNLILSISVLALIGLYVLMAFYYKGCFTYGTWINHVYCTGKSVDEINNELKSTSVYSGLVIKAKDGQSFFVDGALIGYSADYTDELNRLLEEQNTFAWGLNFFTGRDRTINGHITIDEEKLRNILSNWEIFEETSGPNYEIKRDEDGFYLVDNTGDEPIFEAFFNVTKNAILNKEYAIDIFAILCYCKYK